jgi:hypothetical protein
MDQHPPKRQMTLPLSESEQREPLPAHVRERCTELVAQMLMDLATKISQGEDDER